MAPKIAARRLSCPLCGHPLEDAPLEIYHDPFLNRHYEILRCSQCEGDFTSPMEAPGPEWYAQAYPVRLLTASLRIDWRYQLFLRRHPRGSGQRLLDIGTGIGALVGAAQRRGYDAYGVDYDPRTIEWALRHGIKNLTAEPIGAFLARQPDHSFDWITLYEVLEHVESPRALILEAKRLLKPGGGLVVCVPNRRRLLVAEREQHDYPPHHLTRWTARTVQTVLEQTGFRLEHMNDQCIPVRYLAHSLFDAVVAWALKRWRKAVPGAPSQVSGSTDAHQLANKERRQKAVNAIRFLFILFAFPFCTLYLGVYRRIHRHRGVLIYAESVSEGER